MGEFESSEVKNLSNELDQVLSDYIEEVNQKSPTKYMQVKECFTTYEVNAESLLVTIHFILAKKDSKKISEIQNDFTELLNNGGWQFKHASLKVTPNTNLSNSGNEDIELILDYCYKATSVVEGLGPCTGSPASGMSLANQLSNPIRPRDKEAKECLNSTSAISDLYAAYLNLGSQIERVLLSQGGTIPQVSTIPQQQNVYPLDVPTARPTPVQLESDGVVSHISDTDLIPKDVIDDLALF